MGEPHTTGQPDRRRNWRSILAKTSLGTVGIVLLVILGILVWGAGIEPRFLLDVQDEDVEIPNLPPAWEGQTVALLADFQIGMWWDNDGMVDRAVQQAITIDPALVVLAGDFVYQPDAEAITRAVELVRPLTDAGVPTVAVLGNHDYSMERESSPVAIDLAQQLESELTAIGIPVIHNEVEPVIPTGGGEPLNIVGVGSAWAGRSRPARAVEALPIDRPRIVVMHNPIGFRDLPPNTAPLTLAGHTHGGQVRIPFTASSSWLDIATKREIVADGWAEEGIGAPGNRLYVNRGIGFSIVPMRFRCRPELTIFTLRRAGGGALPQRGPDADDKTGASSDV